MLPVENWTLVPCCRHARRLNNAIRPRAMLGLWSNGAGYAPAKCKRCSAVLIKRGNRNLPGGMVDKSVQDVAQAVAQLNYRYIDQFLAALLPMGVTVILHGNGMGLALSLIHISEP